MNFPVVTLNMFFALVTLGMVLYYMYLSVFICSKPSTPVTQRMIRGGGRRSEKQLRDFLKEHLRAMKKALLRQSVLMVILGYVLLFWGKGGWALLPAFLAAFKLYDYRTAIT